MENSMSRVLVGTFVKKAIRDIQQDPERSVRNTVDMAVQFSGGKFQQRFFFAAQRMLQNENSGYYSMLRDTVARVDAGRLYTFGMNAGYNGCTAGARRIRENERKLGCSIPWTLLLQIDTERFGAAEPAYDRLIEEGEALGIHVWMLLADKDPQTVLPLAEKHADSAFILFCEPEDISAAFLDDAAQPKNLMLAARYDEDAAEAYQAVRDMGLLLSIWYPYGPKDLEAIINGTLFYSAQQFFPFFTALLPKQSCPDDVQRLVYQTVAQARYDQHYRTILWEMRGDVQMVDAIISEDACSACFDRDGRLCGHSVARPGFYSMFESSLTDILIGAFPRRDRAD